MNKRSDPKALYIAIASRKFARDGFDGTSLSSLAKEAGVTKQALLHFFGSKERLYSEVLNALALRLCDDIKSTKADDPKSRLSEYLSSFARATFSKPEDAQLVIRALLDSNSQARNWPMKQYLDQLIALIQAASSKTNMPQSEAVGWLFPIIGAVQYLAISVTAIAGMYGKPTANDQLEQLVRFVENSIDELISK